MAAKINRTGKTYGDLTVLETIPGSNSKADTYLVKCNCCGNTMIIGIDALLKGLKCKDCRGKDRKRTYQDLVGEEHNGIKVISLAEDAIGSTGHRNIRYNNQTTYAKRFFERVMMNPAKTMPELHKSFLLLKNKAKANGMRGLYNSSDKKIMALIDMLDGNYPDHLSEKQKGEYLVGYYQQRSANIKDAEEKKNRKAAKIETNNTDTATTVATQKEK